MDHDTSDTIAPRRSVGWRRWALIGGGIAAALLVLATLLLAMFPVGLFRGQLERYLSGKYGAPVTVGALERDRLFSFAPIVSVRALSIRQPGWAGQGDFVRIDRASLRVPMLAALIGSLAPDRIAVDGVRIALVRDANGRSNWSPEERKEKRADDAKPVTLSDLVVKNARFTLADAKRGLVLAGMIAVDARQGFRVDGSGRFLDTPATVTVRAGRITGVDRTAPYPFVVTLASPALHLHGTGMMEGVLNTRKFSSDISVQAPTLKNFDRLIAAGLFGSQPIDLSGHLRHDGRDWYIDRLDARMGRSLFTAKASVLKRNGHTEIKGDIHASQLDFDDLSDDRSRALGAAREARIGPRMLPATHINLSKINLANSHLSLVADRLLARKGTVFRSLRGVLAIDDHVLTISDVVATLDSGRVTGTARVSHRSGLPKLSLDMRFEGATLDRIVGKPDIITGPVRGRIVLAGQGETVREALARGEGKVAMVATQGSVKTVVADVLGQDLGRAIGHVIHQKSDRVPLRCLIADFRGRGGVFVARPVAIDTGNSVGRGTGRVILDGETIALTLAGATRNGSALKITDPIRIGGTMSAPSVTIAGLNPAGGRPSTGSILKVVTRSIGSALGLGDKAPKMAMLPDPLDCAGLTASALR